MEESPQPQPTHSTGSWLAFLHVAMFAGVIVFLVLLEIQILDLQRTVGGSLEKMQKQITRQNKESTDEDNDGKAPSTTEENETQATTPVVEEVQLETYTNSSLGYRVDMYPGTTTQKAQDDVLFKGDVSFDVRRSGDGSETRVNLYLDGEVTGTTTVDGHTANITPSTQGYCDGPTCGQPYIAYSMLEDGYNYTIVFYGDTVLSDTESRILTSFEFLN